MKKAYKNFIFDIDGTLVDTYKASLDSLLRALNETNISITEEEIILHWGIPTIKYFEMIGITDYKELNILWDKYFQEYLKESEFYENIIDVLNKLKKEGHKIGIVTSRDKHEFELDNNMQLIKNLFDGIVLKEDTKLHKPNGEPILKIIEDLNLKKEETVYIGDTEYDSMCANDAGVDFILALWGANNKNIEATYKFDDPKDILNLTK